MPVLQRSSSVSIDWAGENCLEVVSHLKDLFHEIEIVITFDCITQKITDAKAQMITVPFDICHDVCEKMKDLVGLQVKKGVTKVIHEIVGTSSGCTHLAEMSADSVKAAIQAASYCMLPKDMEFEEKVEQIKTANLGVCHTYSNLDQNPNYIGPRNI